MGYPSGIASFANKNAGDTIQPAHVNDLQTEITAVESGLLTGLQHALTISTGGLTVSTGAVTLPSLNVTGPSTFAGPVTFSSGVASTVSFASSVTFSGAVTVTGVLSASLSLPAVFLTHSVTQAMSTTAWTGLNWDTEKFDNQGLHSTSANSSRITFTHSTGLYAVGATVPFSTEASGIPGTRMMVNDSTVAMQAFQTALNTALGSSAGNIMVMSGVVLAKSTTDYITVQGRHTFPSTVLEESTGVGIQFYAYKVAF
jgi:hypothetical protein